MTELLRSMICLTMVRIALEEKTGNAEHADHSLSCVYEDEQVGLFIGSYKHALDYRALEQAHITHIVNCTQEMPNFWEDHTLVDMVDEATNNGMCFVIDEFDRKKGAAALRAMKHYAAGSCFSAKYRKYSILDRPNVDIKDFVKDCHQWLSGEIASSNRINVLFHCMQGISRSSSFLLGFLILKNHWSYDKTHTLIYERYPRIRPNPGFVRQLKSMQVE